MSFSFPSLEFGLSEKLLVLALDDFLESYRGTYHLNDQKGQSLSIFLDLRTRRSGTRCIGTAGFLSGLS
jgi:hypothetical protein